MKYLIYFAIAHCIVLTATRAEAVDFRVTLQAHGTGQPMPDFTVSVSSAQGVIKNQSTDTEGTTLFSNLPPTTYQVDVSLQEIVLHSISLDLSLVGSAFEYKIDWKFSENDVLNFFKSGVIFDLTGKPLVLPETPVVTNPLSLLNIATDLSSPQPPGTRITFTATASGGVAPYQYKWWLYNGVGWVSLSTWTTGNNLSWVPPVANKDFRIGVWVRSSNSTKDASDNDASNGSIEFAIQGEAPPTPEIFIHPAAPTPKPAAILVSPVMCDTDREQKANWIQAQKNAGAQNCSTVHVQRNACGPNTGYNRIQVRCDAAMELAANICNEQGTEVSMWLANRTQAGAKDCQSVKLCSTCCATASPWYYVSCSDRPICPLPQCAAPPEGCNYQGPSATDGSGCPINCGKLICTGGPGHRPPIIIDDFPIDPTAPPRPVVVEAVAGPLSIVSLAPNVSSPRSVGTPVTFTTVAKGGKGPYQYKWWIYDGSWKLLQDWSTQSSYVWAPKSVGNYRIGVWIRNAGDATDNSSENLSTSFEIK